MIVLGPISATGTSARTVFSSKDEMAEIFLEVRSIPCQLSAEDMSCLIASLGAIILGPKRASLLQTLTSGEAVTLRGILLFRVFQPKKASPLSDSLEANAS